MESYGPLDLYDLLGVSMNLKKRQCCCQSVEYSGFCRLFDTFRGLLLVLPDKQASLPEHSTACPTPQPSGRLVTWTSPLAASVATRCQSRWRYLTSASLRPRLLILPGASRRSCMTAAAEHL